MSLSSDHPSVNRWTVAEGKSLAERGQFIRKNVYNYFLKALDKAHQNVEKNLQEKIQHDFNQRQQSQLFTRHANPKQDELERLAFEKRIIQEYLFQDASLTDLRACLGGVQHDIGAILDPTHGEWDVMWTPAIESTMPEDVRFSFNVLTETIERTYGKELSEFDLLWAEFTRKQGRQSHNPLDVIKFVRTLYNTQIIKGIQGELQNLVFLELEQEILQGLGIILFEMQNHLTELGVTLQSRDKIDDVILKRKSVFHTKGEDAQTVNDEALFNTLVDLLKTWEPKIGEGENIRILTSQEVFASIATLQQWAPKVLEEALGHPDGRLGKHLKESLIKQAETLGVPAGITKMSDADEKAVDLVDEVFTQNLYERKMQDAARTILAQMLFPSVKAAILNRRWFAEEDHPARQFILSVTDACVPQTGETDQDSMAKAREAVDKLVAGFNEDVSIFEVLTQEIHSFVQSQIRKEVYGEPEDPENETLRRDKVVAELRQKWIRWHGPQPVLDFALQLGGEYLSSLDKNNERGGVRWGMAMAALEQLLQLRSKKEDKVRIDGVLRDNLIKMLMANGWTGVRAHNRLAEQEDIIHAYYAYGKTDFDHVASPSLSLNNLETPPESSLFGNSLSQNTSSSISVEKQPVNDNSVKTKDLKNHLISDETPFSKELEPLDINATGKLIDPSSISFHKNTMPHQRIEGGDFSHTSPTIQETPIVPEADFLSNVLPNKAIEEDVDGELADIFQSQDTQLDTTIPPPPLTDIRSPQLTPAKPNESLKDKPLLKGKPQSSSSAEVMEMIKEMQLGSHSMWMNTQDELVEVRLSWISPISMKYLFVNKSGARILTGTPKDLLELWEKGRFFPTNLS